MLIFIRILYYVILPKTKLKSMKKIIIVALTLFTLNVNAQVELKTVKIEDELKYMRANLEKSQKIFIGGTVVAILGATIFTAASIAQSKDPTQNFAPITYFGIAMAAIGQIVIIHSHSFIGKAGLGIGGKGVTVKYEF